MANYRASKSGLAREAQAKIDSTFDVEEAKKCLEWIKVMTGEKFMVEMASERFRVMESMYRVLKDGFILCRLIDVLLPPGMKLDFTKKAFQEAKMVAFASARERERIAIFLNKAMEYGVPESCTFQTDYLYEKTNLVQVCTCIRALGIEAQSRPGYKGPIIWPKKAEENKRKFSDDQMNAGQQVISLQYGTNRGASQTGMNFGKHRMIID